MEAVKNQLLDYLIVRFQLKNDRALSAYIGVEPPAISKIRHGRNVSDSMLLRIHESTGIPVAEIRALLPSSEADHG